MKSRIHFCHVLKCPIPCKYSLVSQGAALTLVAVQTSIHRTGDTGEDWSWRASSLPSVQRYLAADNKLWPRVEFSSSYRHWRLWDMWPLQPVTPLPGHQISRYLDTQHDDSVDIYPAWGSYATLPCALCSLRTEQDANEPIVTPQCTAHSHMLPRLLLSEDAHNIDYVFSIHSIKYKQINSWHMTHYVLHFQIREWRHTWHSDLCISPCTWQRWRWHCLAVDALI